MTNISDEVEERSVSEVTGPPYC